jgi:hypothetical protein
VGGKSEQADLISSRNQKKPEIRITRPSRRKINMAYVPFPDIDPVAEQAAFDPALDGPGILRTAKVYLVEVLSGYVDGFMSLTTTQIFLMGAGLALFLVVGLRLERFSKPNSLVAPESIRMVGWCMRWGSFAAMAYGLFSAVVLYVVLALVDQRHLFIEYFKAQGNLLLWGAGGGALVSLPIIWSVIPMWDRGDGLDDVEELVKNFKKFHGYDPLPYFKIEKGCFVGKDQKGMPIYVPWAKLRETHVQVLGTTGSGKGVLMSIIAFQAVLAGEALVWFDPKSDRFAPRLLRQAAMEVGKPFVMLDLNLGQPPQFSLFAGASEFEILDLFVAGLDLRGKGTDGDFHRGRDEDAAMVLADIAVQRNIRSISGLVAACAGVEEVTGAENFWRHLRKLARLDVIDTEYGIDLADVISQGGVIYVRGSSDTEVVKTLQKMVLARVAQIIKTRPESDVDKPVCVVLDELKHLLSMPAVVSLGVIRSFSAHFLLAHQSLGDLEGCASIPPAEVRGAVIDNTAIKFIYRINDGEYAEAISKGAGQRRTYVETTAKISGDSTGLGGWAEQQTPFINPDLFTHLPLPSDRPGQASTGVLTGWGNAKLFYVGPMAAIGPMPLPVEVSKAGFESGQEEPI